MKLDHTAALVMSWAAPLYAEGPDATFVGQLDVSNGQELLARCHDVCPWYGEVIRDRKHFLSHLIQKELASRAEQCQVVIPAAGISPLALELLLSQRDRVTKVIVDIAGMGEKHRLYSVVAPHLADRIACITADITTARFSAGMLEAEGGYQPDAPTIVLFEGISYYITEAQLRRAMSVFRSAKQQNLIVLEHLLPCAFVNEARRSIPSGIFRTIGAYAGLSNIRCYSLSHVESLFQSVRCSEVWHHSSDMERLRKGKPRRFLSKTAMGGSDARSEQYDEASYTNGGTEHDLRMGRCGLRETLVCTAAAARDVSRTLKLADEERVLDTGCIKPTPPAGIRLRKPCKNYLK